MRIDGGGDNGDDDDVQFIPQRGSTFPYPFSSSTTKGSARACVALSTQMLRGTNHHPLCTFPSLDELVPSSLPTPTHLPTQPPTDAPRPQRALAPPSCVAAHKSVHHKVQGSIISFFIHFFISFFLLRNEPTAMLLVTIACSVLSLLLSR